MSFFGKSLQDTEGIKSNHFKLLKPKRTISHNDSVSLYTLQIIIYFYMSLINAIFFQQLIQGCYDVNQNVIYLHLSGVLDIHYLVKTLNQTTSLLSEKG